MNNVNIIGRLTKDPELKYTRSETAYTRFCVAVDGMKDSDGNTTADFIDIIAWKKSAELVTKYFRKGSRIGINGRLHTTSFETENGEKRKFTEVVVNSIDFLDPKKADSDTGSSNEPEPEPEREAPPTAKDVKIQPVESELDLPFEI